MKCACTFQVPAVYYAILCNCICLLCVMLDLYLRVLFYVSFYTDFLNTKRYPLATRGDILLELLLVWPSYSAHAPFIIHWPVLFLIILLRLRNKILRELR